MNVSLLSNDCLRTVSWRKRNYFGFGGPWVCTVSAHVCPHSFLALPALVTHWEQCTPVPVQARFQSAPPYPELHPEPDSDLLPDYLDLDDNPMAGGDLNRSELGNKMVWRSLVTILDDRLNFLVKRPNTNVRKDYGKKVAFARTSGALLHMMLAGFKYKKSSGGGSQR